MSFAIAIPIGAGAAVALGWLGRRWPTAFLSCVLASFAIGPQWVLTGYLSHDLLALAIPAQQALLIAAAAANVARYGFRSRIVNWPVLAVALLLVPSGVLASLDQRLSFAGMALAAIGLSLPWSLVHLILEPGTRVRYALLIALLPILSVAVGLGLDAAGVHSLYHGSSTRVIRLTGANNAGWLACLAFAGFAVALHEAIRARSQGFASLAAINLALAVLSGGRMGVGASVVVAVVYGLLDETIRTRVRRVPRFVLAIGAAAALLALGVWLTQGFHTLRDAFDLSGRGRLWVGYLEQYWRSPIFGHGLGVTALARSYYDLPHNEYLRLLVESGAVGLAIYAAAVLLWSRQIVARADPGERAFVIALLLALAVYAISDNILIMPPALVPFLYLAVILSEPAGARHRCPGAQTRSLQPEPVGDG